MTTSSVTKELKMSSSTSQLYIIEGLFNGGFFVTVGFVYPGSLPDKSSDQTGNYPFV
jgi:hypothetical protein